MKTIVLILEQLQSKDWYGLSEEVEIAKGKYEIISDLKELKKQSKRILKSS